MSITTPERIVEVVAADLAANSGLTPKIVRKFAQPTMVKSNQCPLLAVHIESTDYTPALTAAADQTFAYNRTHVLNVGWYVWDDKAAETGGTGDPQTVHDLSKTVEKLIVQLATYSVGIPTIGSQLIATLRSRAIRPQEGALWRGLVELDIEETT